MVALVDKPSNLAAQPASVGQSLELETAWLHVTSDQKIVLAASKSAVQSRRQLVISMANTQQFLNPVELEMGPGGLRIWRYILLLRHLPTEPGKLWPTVPLLRAVGRCAR